MEVTGLRRGEILKAPAGGARIVEMRCVLELGEFVPEGIPIREFVISERFSYQTDEDRRRSKHDAAISLFNLTVKEIKRLGDGVLAFRKLPVVATFDQTTDGITEYGILADAVIAAYILRPAGEEA